MHQFYKVSVDSFNLRENKSCQRPVWCAFDFGFSFSLRLESRRYRIGGAKRDRTADPLRARQVLSQLSYSPSVQITEDGRQKTDNAVLYLLFSIL
jgi:hypothetical protein